MSRRILTERLFVLPGDLPDTCQSRPHGEQRPAGQDRAAMEVSAQKAPLGNPSFSPGYHAEQGRARRRVLSGKGNMRFKRFHERVVI